MTKLEEIIDNLASVVECTCDECGGMHHASCDLCDLEGFGRRAVREALELAAKIADKDESLWPNATVGNQIRTLVAELEDKS